MAQTCPMSTSLTSARMYTAELQSVINRLDTGAIDRIADVIYQAYLEESTVFVVGNGGSATLATHIACDLGKNISCGVKRIRAISLTDNIAMLTAWANDLNYESVFAEQLRNLVRPGDVVFAISASGNSKNILRAIEVGRDAGARIVGVTGYRGGMMKPLCDLCFVVPSDNMQVIEDLHTVASHAIATILYNRVISESRFEDVGRFELVQLGPDLEPQIDNCAA